MSESRRVIVYLCKVKEAEQLIPRHHVAPVATCEKVAEVSISELPATYAEALQREGEVVITSCEEARKVLSKSLGEGEYLRLVLARA